MGDSEVKRWAADLARGRVTKDQFNNRWGRKAAEGDHGSPEELLERAIQNYAAALQTRPLDPEARLRAIENYARSLMRSGRQRL